MLRMYREYHVDHHRFREHLRVAMVMAMVAPVCAVLFLTLIGWWNAWLWGSCGLGIALALGLYSVVLLHQRPFGISDFALRLINNSANWFPFFFIIVQSLIAALIILFIWFSLVALALDVPSYVNALVVILCCLIPLRRLIWARMEKRQFNRAFVLNEIARAVWHVLMTVFIARLLIGMAVPDPQELTQENLIWQTIIWLPALLYITFTITVTYDHVVHRGGAAEKPAEADKNTREEPLDRF